jgi:branched-chain amino acid aminotransferase
MPAEKASVSVFDRGLVLGDGLFETWRARNGKTQFRSLPERRHVNTARGHRDPVPGSDARLRARNAELCRKSGFGKKADAAVRITLTRGRYSGGLAIDPAVPPTLIIVVMPVSPLPAAVTVRGVKVAISSINKAAASGLDPRVKSLNYLANIFAKAEGDARGCYEAILLGPRGEIAELSTSSFFGIVDGVVVTPPIDTGILPGITRQVLLREMRKKKIPCRETEVFPSDVRRMSEAFLCSSVRGPVPIARIEGRKVGKGVPGPVFARLLDLYSKACEKEIDRS